MVPAKSRLSRLLGIALIISALLTLPPTLLADCLCGNNCGCGDGCQCQLPLEPPPQNPKANTVRKNQNALTTEERQAFIGAILTLKNTYRPGRTISIFDEYANLHMMGMMGANIHEGSAFLPWHRKMLRNFELELQNIDPSVTIP